MIVPPPTPNRPLNIPAAVAIATSLRTRSRATGGDTSNREGRHRQDRVIAVSGTPAAVARLIQPLRDAPAESAALLDVDGTLAPIVDVPGATPRCRTTRARRCASSRDAWRSSPAFRGAARSTPGAWWASRSSPTSATTVSRCWRRGTTSRASTRRPPGAAGAARDFVARALRAVDLEPVRPAARGQGPDPGPSLARRRPTPAAAERRGAADRGSRRARGLEPRWGRKVLELRPDGRDRQGHRRAPAARGRRDRARPVRRRRPHRPRRVSTPCARWSTRASCEPPSAWESPPLRRRRSSPPPRTRCSRARRSSPASCTRCRRPSASGGEPRRLMLFVDLLRITVLLIGADGDRAGRGDGARREPGRIDGDADRRRGLVDARGRRSARSSGARRALRRRCLGRSPRRGPPPRFRPRARGGSRSCGCGRSAPSR